MTPQYQAGIRILAQWVLEIIASQVVESEPSHPLNTSVQQEPEIVTTYERQVR